MKIHFALTALLLAAPLSAAADMYEYVTENGVLSFTDSPRNIPVKYQESARTRQDESLWSYSRVTEVPRGATTAPTSKWAALAEDEDDDGVVEYTGSDTLVQVGGGVSLAAACPDDVIYVESSLYDNYGFIEDSNYYGPTRRVYCGDRLLVYIR
jgi:hypothetical protein